MNKIKEMILGGRFIMKRLKIAMVLGISSIALLTACQSNEDTIETSSNGKAANAEETKVDVEQDVKNENQQQEESMTKGQEMSQILGSTDWQGTKVYDKDNNDLTTENANFIGLAKYDETTGHYEFFDAKTGESRGDKGTFFITNDGEKRILISESMNYQAVVDMIELNNELFTYKRMGKDADGNDVEVFVEHVPYKGKELVFTDPDKILDNTTGDIVKEISGDKTLGSTLWHGTLVLDEEGNNVTEYNSNFISLAKFDDKTNKYEFFHAETGESRGDYGYFAVVNENKIRAHVSIGDNKYGAALEITEMNNNKFTYKRTGKDQDGNDITVFVEHEPYNGDLKPEFTH